MNEKKYCEQALKSEIKTKEEWEAQVIALLVNRRHLKVNNHRTIFNEIFSSLLLYTFIGCHKTFIENNFGCE